MIRGWNTGNRNFVDSKFLHFTCNLFAGLLRPRKEKFLEAFFVQQKVFFSFGLDTKSLGWLGYAKSLCPGCHSQAKITTENTWTAFWAHVLHAHIIDRTIFSGIRRQMDTRTSGYPQNQCPVEIPLTGDGVKGWFTRMLKPLQLAKTRKKKTWCGIWQTHCICCEIEARKAKEGRLRSLDLHRTNPPHWTSSSHSFSSDVVAWLSEWVCVCVCVKISVSFSLTQLMHQATTTKKTFQRMQLRSFCLEQTNFSQFIARGQCCTGLLSNFSLQPRKPC